MWVSDPPKKIRRVGFNACRTAELAELQIDKDRWIGTEEARKWRDFDDVSDFGWGVFVKVDVGDCCFSVGNDPTPRKLTKKPENWWLLRMKFPFEMVPYVGTFANFRDVMGKV